MRDVPDSLTSLWLHSLSFLIYGDQNWTLYSRCASSWPSKGKRPPPSTCCPHSSQCTPGFQWLPWVDCWLMGSLSSMSTMKTPRSFSVELLSSRSALSLHWCLGLFLPWCRTQICLWWTALGFTYPILQPVLVPLKGSTSSRVSATPPVLYTSNLLRVHSITLFSLLVNQLNKTRPSKDPWESYWLQASNLLIISEILSHWLGVYTATRKIKTWFLYDYRHQGKGSPTWSPMC